MEPENHPFDTQKLCIFQISNLHVSLPNVSFHGCTTPRGSWKNLAFFGVLLSLNQLLCVDRKEMKETTGRKKKRKEEGCKGEEMKKGTDKSRKEKGKNWKGRKEKQPAKQKSNKLLPNSKNLLDNTKQKFRHPNQKLPKNTNLCGGNNHHTFPTSKNRPMMRSRCIMFEAFLVIILSILQAAKHPGRWREIHGNSGFLMMSWTSLWNDITVHLPCILPIMVPISSENLQPSFRSARRSQATPHLLAPVSFGANQCECCFKNNM